MNNSPNEGSDRAGLGVSTAAHSVSASTTSGMSAEPGEKSRRRPST
ncbi:hypothetical protein [Actinophytocola sp.]|nr:hypothetical protein [Actinophytocola sp.]HYQ62250.1 hypothetical protein [Actinophytocola sp.]